MLYNFKNDVTDDTYQGYLDKIEKLLKSEASASFLSEYFANTIINTLLTEIGIEA